MLKVWAIEPGRPKSYWREVGWAEIHGDMFSFALNSMPLQRFEISESKPKPLTPETGGVNVRQQRKQKST